MSTSSVPVFSGRRIVELRNRAGITQAELARRANVHVAQLSKWENGKKPRVDVAGILAAALGCDVSELFVDGEEVVESDDEEADLLEAAHALDRAGVYALADRLRRRARAAGQGAAR